MPKYLYTYVPKDNTVDRDGLLSTWAQHGLEKERPEKSGWRKYKSLAKENGYPATRQGVMDWLDSSMSGFRRSMAVSVLTEPIPEDDARISEGLRSLRDNSRLYRITPAAKLLAAGVLNNVWKVNWDHGFHGLVKDTAKVPIAWEDSLKDQRWRFTKIPHYMLETADGHIPPEYVEEIKDA